MQHAKPPVTPRQGRPASPRSRPRRLEALAAAMTLGLAVASALAVQPARWTHTTESDFADGKNENTVVSSLGDVKLAMASQTLGQMPEQATILYDLQPLGDAVYMAAGPEAKLLVRRNDKIDTVLALEGEQVFALDLTSDGKLLVAVSGPKSRLAVLEGDQLRTLVEFEGVRYIWDLLVDGAKVYLATGTEGKLLQAERGEEGKYTVTELLDTQPANILCLARDAQGNIYAGTDGEGLVYRIGFDRGKPLPFVLYDAPEPEIGALVVLPDGSVFAGTADAEQSRPGRIDRADVGENGRPAGDGATPPPGGAPVPGGPADGDANVPPHAADHEQPDAPVPPVPAPAGPGIEPKTNAPLAHPRPLALADPPPADSIPQPTPEQRDRLREIIRRRLEEARKTGALPAASPGKPTPGQRRRPTVGPARPALMRGQAAGPREGNAIYRIDPQGFVTEVFRDSAMILRMVPDPGAVPGQPRLLVATGDEGHLYRISAAGDESAVLLDLDAQQIPAIAVVTPADAKLAPHLLLGTANPATLVRLDSGVARDGTYTSPVLDATQISLWGRLNLTAQIAPGTMLSVETRSGNVADPEQAPWSEWSKTVSLRHDERADPLRPVELPVLSPPARFLQYRLKFASEGKATAVADRVDLSYMVPNLKPAVASIKATYPNQPQPGGPSAGPGLRLPARPMPGAGQPDDEPQPATVLNIEWEASDPNNDQLRYKLEYLPAGARQWLLIAENLTQTSHEWQTRNVPDGRCILRVTASDDADNPPDMALAASRTSDPVILDNTQPAFVKPLVKVANGVTTITASVEDNLSNIQAVSYRIDSKPQWKPVLPDAPDLIFDSTRENVTVTIPNLSPGQHVVTLRAIDAQGNARYEAMTIEVK